MRGRTRNRRLKQGIPREEWGEWARRGKGEGGKKQRAELIVGRRENLIGLAIDSKIANPQFSDEIARKRSTQIQCLSNESWRSCGSVGTKCSPGGGDQIRKA